MKYSIITINYNNREGLERTIDSVLCQSYRDFEYIIIDGGSNDGSVSIIKKHIKELSYWVSEPDSGIYNAMNKGIAHAQGEYLNFMNSGDCFFDNFVLEKMEKHLSCDIVEGRIYDLSTQRFSYKSTIDPTMMFFYRAGLGHQACFIRRNLLLETPYDENLHLAADWYFFVKKIVFDNCTYHYVELPVASFEGNGTSTKNMDEYEKERQQVLNNIFTRRILADYERFYDKESPMIDLIPSFNKTERLQRIILTFTKLLIKIHKILK